MNAAQSRPATIKRALTLHPFFFGLLPVVSQFSINLAEATFSETAIPALLTVGFSASVLLCFQLLFRDLQRAAPMASGFVWSFFFSMPIYFAVRGWGISPLQLIGGLLSILCFYVFFLARTKIALAGLNRALNLTAFCLIAFHLLNIAVYMSRQHIDWQGIGREQDAESIAIPKDAPAGTPDIYYIIMDRYASESTLNTVYGFDNREFLDYLAHNGFFVASKSHANYLTTRQPLASSLNFQYINYLAKHVDVDSNYRIPIHKLIEDFRLRRVLKTRGYRYFHLGSWWEPTRENRFADRNIRFNPLPEMFYVLSQTTMAYPMASRFGIFDIHRNNWENARRQFRDLADISTSSGPKFVFAHFLLPHDPYVFDREGNFVRAEEVAKKGNERSYVEQLIYTNRMLKTVIDRLLSDRKRRPIIVLQADEGPWPARHEKNSSGFDWNQATDEELKQKMGILNGYYLPGVETSELHESISPVNSFRLILNLYFKTSLPLLPDESFVFPDYHHPYRFLNVTAKLKHDQGG